MSSSGSSTATAAAAAAAASNAGKSDGFNVREHLQKSPCPMEQADAEYDLHTTGITGAPEPAKPRQLMASLADKAGMADGKPMRGLLDNPPFKLVLNPMLGGSPVDVGLMGATRDWLPAMTRKEVIEAIMGTPGLDGQNKIIFWELCQAAVAFKVKSEQRSPKASK